MPSQHDDLVSHVRAYGREQQFVATRIRHRVAAFVRLGLEQRALAAQGLAVACVMRADRCPTVDRIGFDF